MLYKMEEWESPSGWHAGCTQKLGQDSNVWYLPARILGISPAEYMKLVLAKYKPDKLYFNREKCLFFFSWTDQAAMRRYKNDINAAARRVNFQI